jgi:hypothetical protein
MFSRSVRVFLLLFPLVASGDSREGQELIGTPAPNLSLDHWVNSSPREISRLK